MISNNFHSHLHKVGQFSTYMAFASFAIGTLLLVLHLIFADDIIIFIVVVFYVAVAFVINLVVILYLFYYYCMHADYREYFVLKMGIVLMNLPIAVAYFFIVIR